MDKGKELGKMDWQIPLTDLSISEDDVNAVVECLRSGWLTMGERTKAFESAIAHYIGAEYAVAVSSGTAALHLALLLAGVGPGDEVIVPDITFVATASAARFVGATPVLCDVIGDSDLNLDPEDVVRRTTRRTRAVIAVHFCGYPAATEALAEHCERQGITLIEDCAQAFGARLWQGGEHVGLRGRIAAFSFFSKGQLCVGEGGALVTNDKRLADRARRLRSHALTSSTWDRHRGHDPLYDVTEIGFNYRLDEARAALGLSRLSRVDADIDARRRTVLRYRERLTGLDALTIPWTEETVACSSHFSFPVLVPSVWERNSLRVRLRERGIQTTCYPALHTLSDLRAYDPGDLRRSESVAERMCVLPLSAKMGAKEVDTVCAAVEQALTPTG